MINPRALILEHIISERDYYKKVILPIQIKRNEMYETMPITEWDEVNESYKTAIFMQLFDELLDKLTNVSVEDLYCELEDLNLSEIFEPSN